MPPNETKNARKWKTPRSAGFTFSAGTSGVNATAGVTRVTLVGPRHPFVMKAITKPCSRTAAVTRFLTFVFAADAFISISFGLASAFVPLSIYSTIVDLRGQTVDSLPVATLVSLSWAEVFLGLVCVIACFVPGRAKAALAGVMALRHGVIGFKKVGELSALWLVGNPWPDLVIHGSFVVLFVAVAVLQLTRGQHLHAPPAAR